MSQAYVVGVDGGGTHLRSVVTTERLQVLGSSLAGSANPSLVGREVAAERIVTAIRGALNDAAVPPEAVAAVALGIAGGSAVHSEDWLRAVGQKVLPQALVVPSADYEIALAGANGRLEGVVIAAGTGSVAYGVAADGESALVGGWGYLLGDEGSGYWLGLEGLRAVARAEDGQGPPTLLTESLSEALKLPPGRAAMIAWLYRGGAPRNREIASLASRVLLAAHERDRAAVDIVRRGATHLAAQGRTVATRLALDEPHYAFAGGLLTEPNPLSLDLCRELGLADLPRPKYPPVLGAALLALRTLGEVDADRE